MKLSFKTPKCLKRFATNQSGAIAVITALTAVPVLLAAGTAIDLVRLYAAQSHIQNTIDAAALTAASLKNKTTAERIAAAKKSFDFNIKTGAAAGMSPKADFKVVDDKVIANVKIEVPTALMQLAGINVMKGQAQAEVNILADKKAEIVMVLDYSGSMGDPVGGKIKYKVMRDAATKLVTDLSKSDPDSVKFGLVPFSNYVNTTLPSAFVLDGTGTTWTGCTQDRQSSFNVSDATPTNDPGSKWNQAPYQPTKEDIKNRTDDADQLLYGCDGLKNNNLKTVDLTKKFNDITSQLSAMTPFGYTHIALGVEFGYHMLSPNAPFTQGVEYNDKNTKKFMVVLTDGEQKTRGFGPNSGKVVDGRAVEDGRTVTAANTNFETLCNNAKANGITMITMAFDLDDAPTVARLRGCATDASKNFFVANDANSLAAAFETIKDAVTAEIVLSK
jgi:Flp pilus assembly protein TadG